MIPAKRAEAGRLPLSLTVEKRFPLFGQSLSHRARGLKVLFSGVHAAGEKRLYCFAPAVRTLRGFFDKVNESGGHPASALVFVLPTEEAVHISRTST